MESPGFAKPTHTYGIDLLPLTTDPQFQANLAEANSRVLPEDIQAIVDDGLFAGELWHGPLPELPEKWSEYDVGEFYQHE